MPLPPALESLMRQIPPMGRTAPSAPALAAGGGAPPAPVGAPAPGGAGPGSPGGGSDVFSSVVNARMSQSSGADPQYFMEILNKMKTEAAGMLPKAILRYPNQVDRQLQNLLRAIDASLKAFQEAQAHASAASGNPIDFAGAQIGNPTGMPGVV